MDQPEWMPILIMRPLHGGNRDHVKEAHGHLHTGNKAHIAVVNVVTRPSLQAMLSRKQSC